MKKKILYVLIAILILLLAVGVYFYQAFKPQVATFGITYSGRYAAYLGFDPRQVYMDILTDLKPQKMRLMAYWEDIEPERGKFDFTNMDQMLMEAARYKVDIILVLGHKQPRWPECHQPDWFNGLNPAEQNPAVLNMVKQATEHFKQFSAIKSWQIENEPYFVFGGSCSPVAVDLVQAEIQTVKALDNRPVVITDSGEMGNWERAADLGADQLGVTMYRTVHSDTFGYYQYPLPPLFYRIKAGVFEKLKNKPLVGIELQAEPWFTKGVFGTDLDTQKSLMNAKIFQENVQYARRVGFGDNYLWGVEWWYWMAKTKDDWGMWTTAKDLLAGQ